MTEIRPCYQRKMQSSYEIYDSNNSQQNELKTPLVRESGMDNELSRLATFFSFPFPPSVSPTELAKAGFHYKGNKDEVVCHKCLLKYSNWQKGDDPESKHLELSPDCPFFRSTNNSEEEAAGDINAADNKCRNQSEEEIGKMSVAMGGLAVGDVDDERKNCIDSDPQTMKKSEIPESSVMNATKTPTVGDTSAHDNPLYLQTVADNQAHDGSITSTIRQGLQSPVNRNNSVNLIDIDIPRNGEDVPNTERIGHNLLVNSSDSLNTSTGALELETVQPRYPTYAILSTRLRSYRNWPEHLKQRPEDLAKAGLFYEGESDFVRCFHCAGGLREWEPEDDPFFEHARWFPICPFMRLVKGDQFIMGVQSGSIKATDLVPAATNKDKSEELDLSNHPAVLSLKDIGYNADIITKALDVFRKKKDKPALTAEHLLQIVFDIEENQEKDNVNSEETVADTRTGNDESADICIGNDESTESNFQQISEGSQTESMPPSEVTTDLELLREENRELREQKTCKVCLDEEASIVFLPCGHLVTCPMCASALRKCPVCRTYIRGTVKAIIS